MTKKEAYVLPGKEHLPYSAAVRAGDFIYVSGVRGDENNKGIPITNVTDQTRQCLENIKEALKAADASLSDVVKVGVFIIKAEDWALMNEGYKEYFLRDQPARSAIVTGLIRPTMLVEIECTAYKP